MPVLGDVLNEIDPLEVKGRLDREIGSIAFDSRRVGPGDVFVALKGTLADGHMFIDKAVERGAVAIVAERLDAEPAPGSPTFVRVPDSAEALGWMASAFFGYPARELEVVGVTGTNGKTTTVTLLHDLFQGLGYKAGLLSTVENRIGEQVLAATHTTPDPMAIHGLLREMADSGCTCAFMEVSSHAAHQRRIAGLPFRGAVFTNLTRDHLDYHKTFKAYIAAKKLFFDHLPEEAFALVNADDKHGQVMVQNTKAKVYTYSLRRLADYRAKLVESSLFGLELELEGAPFFSRLIGAFNAYNLLAAYGVARLLGQDAQEVMTELSRLQPAEGRFSYVQDAEGRTGIVDYAHSPDALEKVMQTLSRIRDSQARLIIVVGCGGDRDKGKRPQMAKIACDYSQQVVFTSDNPRFEKPEAILDDMEAGIPAGARQRVLRITDRREAIRAAVALARPGDIVLVAGKGHEKYQEIEGVKYPFDDLKELKQLLAK